MYIHYPINLEAYTWAPPKGSRNYYRQHAVMHLKMSSDEL
jgi:hypothetical protein